MDYKHTISHLFSPLNSFLKQVKYKFFLGIRLFYCSVFEYMENCFSASQCGSERNILDSHSTQLPDKAF